MHSDKAPGPDGMLALYLNFWDIVGRDVTVAVLAFWEHCMMVNYLRIGMIRLWLEPLIDSAPYYRMSLDNPKLPSYQINRQITDNIILGYECVHWMQNYRKGKWGYAALKIDMSKAYDRIECIFLKVMMVKLGFSPSWIDKIMNCVTTVRYNFILNQ